MKYKLKVYSIWEFGQRVDAQGNPHQEDSIFPAYGEQKETDRLFILCDGMGGHEAGEVASATVCKAMSQSVFESTPDAEGDFTDDNFQKAVSDAFDALDALTPADVSSEKKMGTTMTFLKFHSKGCTIAHMGDSRVYHIRPGKDREGTRILFQTVDHSLVNDLIKIGELTPEEAKHSKQKNIITRAMQPRMERRPKADIYHTSDIKPGDYFYMCSDGMLEQMEDEHLCFNFSEAAGDDENKVKILTQATSQNSDNHSAIIVHVLEVIDPLSDEDTPVPSSDNQPAPVMAEVENEKQEKDKAPVPVSKPSKGGIPKLPASSNQKKGNLLNYIIYAIIFFFAVWGIYRFSSQYFGNPHTNNNKEERVQPKKDPKHRDHKTADDPATANATSDTAQSKPDSVNQQSKVSENVSAALSAVADGSADNSSTDTNVFESDSDKAQNALNKKD